MFKYLLRTFVSYNHFERSDKTWKTRHKTKTILSTGIITEYRTSIKQVTFHHNSISLTWSPGKIQAMKIFVILAAVAALASAQVSLVAVSLF